MKTKFVIEIIWNQMLIDKIENKIQLEKWKKKVNKKIRIKFDIKIKWNKMMNDEIEEKK